MANKPPPDLVLFLANFLLSSNYAYAHFSPDLITIRLNESAPAGLAAELREKLALLYPDRPVDVS